MFCLWLHNYFLILANLKKTVSKEAELLSDTAEIQSAGSSLHSQYKGLYPELTASKP